MRIVLRDSAYARKSAELSRLLIAVNHRAFAIAHRYFPEAIELAVKNLDVVRTAHRFENEVMPLARFYSKKFV